MDQVPWISLERTLKFSYHSYVKTCQTRVHRERKQREDKLDQIF